MLEGMNRICAAEDMWEYCVKIYHNLHLREALMQLKEAKKANLPCKKYKISTNKTDF